MSIHLSMPSDLVGVIQQETMNADDLYTPKYTRFSGAQKEGYCDLCSPGKWLKMKNSTFWYHKQFFHGISHKTCTWFDSPSETRMNKDVPEGKCHKCVDWIPLLKQKRKNGNINWFHHAASCHFREDKRKRYDTEDLLNELKRRKDDLSEDEYDLASLQPQSHSGNNSLSAKSPTNAGNTVSPPKQEFKKSPPLPVLKPDTMRPRPPINNIDVSHSQYHSSQVSPNNLQHLSPQDRAHHENLLQLQLHHMQQIQQIQMMLYSPNNSSNGTINTNSQLNSPQQISPQHMMQHPYPVLGVDGTNPPISPRPIMPQQRFNYPQPRPMQNPNHMIDKTLSRMPILPSLAPLQESAESYKPETVRNNLNTARSQDEMFFE
eukprot:NODE_39_length_29903_cov_0.529057.p7 type:complete len:375 gc:universal NODE_39_length_29903_cov_0.529057:2574-1450(-)